MGAVLLGVIEGNTLLQVCSGRGRISPLKSSLRHCNLDCVVDGPNLTPGSRDVQGIAAGPGQVVSGKGQKGGHPMDFQFTEEQEEIRKQVRALCSRFPDEYWRERDETGAFPWDFYQAVADGG